MKKKFFLIIFSTILLVSFSLLASSQFGSIFQAGSGDISQAESGASGSSSEGDCEALRESADTTATNGLPANTGDGGFVVSAVKPNCGRQGAIDISWDPNFFAGFDQVKAQCFSFADTLSQNFDNPSSEQVFSTSTASGSLSNCHSNGAVLLIPHIEQ